MEKSYDDYIHEIDIQVEEIVARAQAYMLGLDAQEVRDHIWMAYEFARDAHKGVTRLSGNLIFHIQLLRRKFYFLSIQILRLFKHVFCMT